MRVHVIQLAYGDDEPMAERIERVAALVRGQAGADLVVLPELWAHTGFSYRGWPQSAQPVDGSAMTAVARAAGEIRAYVHAGSIVESGTAGEPGIPGEPGRHRRWNTSVFFGPDGSRLAGYRKIHLFGFAAGEPAYLDAGDRVVTVPMSVDGKERCVGLATCYDLRFPEMFRRLLEAGAELTVIPAAWPLARVGHWTILGRARAIENQSVVIQCNTAGTHGGYPMGGRSQVVAADGTVLAEAGEGEEVLVADVDLDATASYRSAFPVLRDRRL